MNLPRSGSHRTRRGGANSRRGRWLLVMLFFILRSSDLFVYFATPPINRSQILSSLITSGIWTTALLIAVGYRKNWARYILAGILVLGVIASIMYLSALFQENSLDYKVAGVLAIGGLTHAGTFCCLIYSRSIRRLTTRS